MLIDQHRAHVRVLFDRYMTQIRQRQGVSQGVLFPELIQLPVSEAAVLESLSDVGGSRFRPQSFRWRQLRYQWYSFRHRGVESGGTGAQYGTYRHGERQ